MSSTISPPRSHPSPEGRGDPSAGVWVDATPFRAWVRQLVSDTSLPWRVIARAAGVPSGTVRTLLCGRDGRPLRKLRHVDASLLLRLDHNKLVALAGEPARAASLRALAWSLGLHGCSPADIASLVGCDIRTINTLMAGGDAWCSRLQHLRAEACCEAWGIDPGQVVETALGEPQRHR